MSGHELELAWSLASVILTGVFSLLMWWKANMNGVKEKGQLAKALPTIVLAIAIVGIVQATGMTSIEAKETLKPFSGYIIMCVNVLIAMYFKKRGWTLDGNGNGGTPSPTSPPAAAAATAPPAPSPDNAAPAVVIPVFLTPTNSPGEVSFAIREIEPKAAPGLYATVGSREEMPLIA